MYYGNGGESVCSINEFSSWAALQERWVSVNTYLKTPPTHHLVIMDHIWRLEMIIHRFISVVVLVQLVYFKVWHVHKI